MGYIYIVGGQVQGSASMGRLIDLTDGPGTYTANGYLKVNPAGTGWTLSTELVIGDAVFEEKTCELCHQPFKVGDKITLIVTKVAEEGTYMRPAHHNCMGG